MKKIFLSAITSTICIICILSFNITKNEKYTSNAFLQDGVINTDAQYYDYWKDIGYYEAKEMLGNSFKNNCVVAVIDTGADLDHPALAGNLWNNDGEINGKAGVDDDGNGYVDDFHGINTISPGKQPEDDTGNSHGTHVAGIIAMNNSSVSGVGMNCKLMILKAGTENNTLSEENVIKAVNYAVDNGADIINMSFGGVSSFSKLEPVLANASKKCILVAAAGNKAMPTSEGAVLGINAMDYYPAALPCVVGVMACDENRQITNSSNWCYINGTSNDKYSIMAPGQYIYSTIRGGKYGLVSGTSMAAPMVSGAYAVVINFLKTNYTFESREKLLAEATKAIHATTKTITYVDLDDKAHTFKALNIYDSLKYIQDSHVVKTKLKTPVITSIKINVRSNTFKIKWKSIKNRAYYDIYRADGINGIYRKLAGTKNNYYVDKSVKTGVRYFYKVKARGTGKYKDSAYSARVSAMMLGRPGNVKYTISKKNIRISWSNVKQKSGYRIWAGKEPNSCRLMKITGRNNIVIKNNRNYRYIRIVPYKKIDGKIYTGKYVTIRI